MVSAGVVMGAGDECGGCGVGGNVYIVVNEVMSVNGVGLIAMYNSMW